MIRGGRVKVNGLEAKALDQKIGPDDAVTVDGKLIRPDPVSHYVAFNKPVGVVVSFRRFSDPTIYDILPETMRNLRYAGRLDKDSRGLVLLSSDGRFLQSVSHPSHRILKRYLVTVDTIPPGNELERNLYRGVVDDGDLLRVVRAQVRDREKNIVEIILAEGKKRQIRRMLGGLDIKVLDLFRVSVGGVDLENMTLREGEAVEIDPGLVFGSKPRKNKDPEEEILGEFDPW